MTDLRSLPAKRLRVMAGAGDRILECYRVLRKSNANVVAEVLRGQGEFYEWDHYPKGDAYDHETHGQYYYHSHPADLRGGEHGHFHTFVRPKGMPAGVKPAPLADFKPPKDKKDALSHLVAISTNKAGYPVRLFTTNRWVTGETWYAAKDVIRLVDRFLMDLAYPSWPVNIWITEMLRLFRPQIEELLLARDRTVGRWQADHPEGNTCEDRGLEITSVIEISVERQIEEVRRARAAA